MKTAKEYIIEKNKTLVKAFPELKFSYQIYTCPWESDIDNDIIVSPAYLYKNNKEFAKAESKIFWDFKEKYPDEGIIFVSDDDEAIELENPCFEAEGYIYKYIEDIKIEAVENIKIKETLTFSKEEINSLAA